MVESHASLSNYLLHEGEIDGVSSVALLHTERGWHLGTTPTVSAHPLTGGFQSLKIEGEGRSIELRAVDMRLIQIVLEHGLHIIYQDERGESQSILCSVV